jgi:RNA polymerase primary sigma factor
VEFYSMRLDEWAETPFGAAGDNLRGNTHGSVLDPSEGASWPEGLDSFLESAQKRGYILYSELKDLIISDANDYDMETLIATVLGSGIRLLSEPPPVVDGQGQLYTDGRSRAPEGGTGLGVQAPNWFSPEDADYYRWLVPRIRSFFLLTAQEEKDLGKRIAQGDQAARDRMIEGNQRLVLSIAKRYVGRGVPLADLTGEGNLGLIRATEKYDVERGTRFSTYAVWWIRQSTTRALTDQSRLVRISVHTQERLSKVDDLRSAFRLENGREPTKQELADDLGVHVEKIMRYLTLGEEPLLLQDTLPQDAMLLDDIVAGRSRPGPEEDVFNEGCKAQLECALETLPERNRRILVLREGLHGECQHTLEEVGTALGLTRERVRQIEEKAKRQLLETIAQENGVNTVRVLAQDNVIRHRTASNRRRMSPGRQSR